MKFCHRHKDIDKEIAYYGGSFTCLPLNSQLDLYDKITPFLDEKTFLRYSTRPDGINDQVLSLSKSKHVRTIELGIQDFDDHVLLATQRGYTREIALQACKQVKANDIRLSIQLMPGLPGYSAERFEQTIRDTIAVVPDYVRIYPTLVIKGTPLEQMYRDGCYQPLTLESAMSDVSSIVEKLESAGITVIKVGLSGIEKSQVVAGPFHPAFGELVRAEIYTGRIIQAYETDKVLEISVKDRSLLLGNQKEYLTRIKHKLKQTTLKVKVTDTLHKGEFRLISDIDFESW